MSRPGPSVLGSSLDVDAGSIAHYRIQGVDVVVRSNDENVLARVRETYGWFEADPDRPLDERVAPVTVALVRATDGTSTVTDAEGQVRRWRDEDQPLTGLFDAIVAGTIAAVAARGVLAVHAGVVAIDGRAILVAGRSGAGKTTLVLGLLRQGLDLLSDELALIAPNDRTVLAYPRGLHIRPGSLALFPELGYLAQVPGHELGGGSEWALGPDAVGRAFGTSVVQAARIGAVVLLDAQLSPDGAPELTAVPGAIATMELLRGTPAAARDFEGTLARLSRMVADVPTARLRSGRLDETVDAVLDWAIETQGAER